MTWEQHRYAVERARDMRRKAADAINDCCVICDGGAANECACTCPGGPTYAGVTLQGEANGSDAEMLDEVADFLKSLEGSKRGDIHTPGGGQHFIDDWNKQITGLSNFCAMYGLSKPDMIFHREWQEYMTIIAGQRIGSPIIYAGVRVRFGTLTPMDVLVTP